MVKIIELLHTEFAIDRAIKNMPISMNQNLRIEKYSKDKFFFQFHLINLKINIEFDRQKISWAPKLNVDATFQFSTSTWILKTMFTNIILIEHKWATNNYWFKFIVFICNRSKILLELILDFHNHYVHCYEF